MLMLMPREREHSNCLPQGACCSHALQMFRIAADPLKGEYVGRQAGRKAGLAAGFGRRKAGQKHDMWNVKSGCQRKTQLGAWAFRVFGFMTARNFTFPGLWDA